MTNPNGYADAITEAALRDGLFPQEQRKPAKPASPVDAHAIEIARLQSEYDAEIARISKRLTEPEPKLDPFQDRRILDLASHPTGRFVAAEYHADGKLSDEQWRVVRELWDPRSLGDLDLHEIVDYRGKGWLSDAEFEVAAKAVAQRELEEQRQEEQRQAEEFAKIQAENAEADRLAELEGKAFALYYATLSGKETA